VASSIDEEGICDIKSHLLSDIDFSKTLLIHGGLGRGALVYAESRQSRVKNPLLDHIESTLFLPIKQDIRPKLNRIIDNAIDLAMTR
jgi:hypothetical protein